MPTALATTADNRIVRADAVHRMQVPLPYCLGSQRCCVLVLRRTTFARRSCLTDRAMQRGA